ncbi:MAG: membrane protein insertion efficiency factor YidD [Phreatobacter sp.]|nr:membrane protein insertion efficiency factor YidD [Phreatobacter sp.]
MSRDRDLDRLFDDWRLRRWPRLAGHGLLRAYQLSISMLVGRWCRHLPSCSAYMDEAMMRHGFWAGGWMGLARLCRCHPYGTSGIDNPPTTLPAGARWFLPWRYGAWQWRRGAPVCEKVGPGGDA